MRLLIVATCAALGALGCGADDSPPTGACGDDEVSLAFLEPTDGAMLTSSDDLDPTMAGLQTQIRLRACGFAPDDQVIVYLLDPVETEYAILTVDDGTPVTVVPLIPGMLRFEARSMDGGVASEIVGVDVMLD